MPSLSVKRILLLLLLLSIISAVARQSHAQTFGIELHNKLMPASGGMAGTSIARPQDLQSAINGNPATLTQFRGTQFSFGGAWAEATFRIDQQTRLPLVDVDPYNEKSATPGAPLGNIGVTQDFSVLGMPATAGLGFFANAAAGVDFRGVPEAQGTSVHYVALDIVSGVGVDVTERLSAGAALTLGSSFLDAPFAGTSAMVPAYALRGTLGLNYQLGCNTTVGAYWQTKKSFSFQEAVQFGGGPFQTLRLQHPQNLGVGVANSSLMDGRLLLAADVLYKQHSDANLLQAIYDDQWVLQFGAQYSLNRKVRLRLGYSYSENPMRSEPLASGGGVMPPDGIPAMRYLQGQFASINQHRLTGGVGLRDVLPGIDFDLFAGGMFEATDTFGDTTATVKGYWLGAGLTWRFGRGCCCRLPVPDSWAEDCPE